MRAFATGSIGAVLVLLAIGQTGCRALSHGQHGSNPSAEQCFRRGKKLDRNGEACCVDWYFAAARLSWQEATGCESASDAAQAQHLYQASLAALLPAAQRLGRLNPTTGLAIQDGETLVTVPIVHEGHSWSAADFQRLLPPPTGREPLLQRRYCCPGIGMPLVVQRWRNDCNPVEARFFPPVSAFATTAVLRFADDSTPAGAAVLEFHNPAISSALSFGPKSQPLAKDLTAPLAVALADTPRTYLAGFIEPGEPTTASALQFLEPYQPGKIPVVLIHGLFSDPQSFADMTNDLRAAESFAARYQIWTFRYPTGQGFLRSAAALREELRAAIEQLDPQQSDPALSRMVLVGHSMGGLIAKLQVTHSSDLVWNQVANRPLEEIVASDVTRAQLTQTCFFDPSPHVSRVIFIATPHRGSLAASELIGRGASLLVEETPQQAAMHEQLLSDNPGTFSPLLDRRFPTSIDLLTPSSPLLAAMRQMPVGPGVALHNIVGVSHPLSLDGPSDGIVSVRSGWHPDCESELAVGAPHAKVHRTLAASREVSRILCEHYASSGLGGE